MFNAEEREKDEIKRSWSISRVL